MNNSTRNSLFRLKDAFLFILFFIAMILFSTHVDAEVQVTNAQGQTVLVRDSSRIVSIGGALTEIIYALGAEDRLVGVDTTSVLHINMQELPRVGHRQALSEASILSQLPTLIINTEDAGQKELLNRLLAAGVDVLTLSALRGAPGITLRILRISQSLELPDKGIELIGKF